MNGPLHIPEAALDNRLIWATYATPGEAEVVRNLLFQDGIAADHVNVFNVAASISSVQADLQPNDQGVLALVREALAAG